MIELYVSPVPADGFIKAAVVVLVFVLVDDAVLDNGLLGMDAEVMFGLCIESLFDEFVSTFGRLNSNSCNFFQSSSRSRSRFFSLQ